MSSIQKCRIFINIFLHADLTILMFSYLFDLEMNIYSTGNVDNKVTLMLNRVQNILTFETYLENHQTHRDEKLRLKLRLHPFVEAYETSDFNNS